MPHPNNDEKIQSGSKIVDLYRQIHPLWFTDGRVSSLAFQPKPHTKNNKKCLSVYNGDTISTTSAISHYENTLKLETCGIAIIPNLDYLKEGLTIDVDREPFEAHASIYFINKDGTNFGRSRRDRIKNHLMILANRPGCFIKK